MNNMLPVGAAGLDVREAQWATKREAVAAIKAIGWPVSDAQRVTRMGFYVWVIMDPHGRTVSMARYQAMLTARQAALKS